jgi:hypothetical protein
MAIPAFFMWAILSDRKTSKKEMEALVKKQKDWLAEQNLKPKFRVKVKTKGGEIVMSSTFEPTCEIDWLGQYYLDKDSSRDKAERCIENFISRGRYVHEDTGYYVPLCEIKCFEVIKV